MVFTAAKFYRYENNYWVDGSFWILVSGFFDAIEMTQLHHNRSELRNDTSFSTPLLISEPNPDMCGRLFWAAGYNLPSGQGCAAEPGLSAYLDEGCFTMCILGVFMLAHTIVDILVSGSNGFC